MIKSQLFNGMLADCAIDEEIITVRSPKLFEHVYAYLIDSSYPYPRKYYAELDYYLISYDIDELYDPHKKCKEDAKTMFTSALSNICKMISNIPGGKCLHKDCKNIRARDFLVCWSHMSGCVYDSSGYRICYNDTNGHIPFCEEHIFTD